MSNKAPKRQRVTAARSSSAAAAAYDPMNISPPFVNNNYDFMLEATAMELLMKDIGIRINTDWDNASLNQRKDILDHMLSRMDLNVAERTFLVTARDRVDRDLRHMGGDSIAQIPDLTAEHAVVNMLLGTVESVSYWSSAFPSWRKGILEKHMRNPQIGEVLQYIFNHGYRHLQDFNEPGASAASASAEPGQPNVFERTRARAARQASEDEPFVFKPQKPYNSSRATYPSASASAFAEEEKFDYQPQPPYNPSRATYPSAAAAMPQGLNPERARERERQEVDRILAEKEAVRIRQKREINASAAKAEQNTAIYSAQLDRAYEAVTRSHNRQDRQRAMIDFLNQHAPLAQDGGWTAEMLTRKIFALILHPDKNPDQKEKYAILFKKGREYLENSKGGMRRTRRNKNKKRSIKRSKRSTRR